MKHSFWASAFLVLVSVVLSIIVVTALRPTQGRATSERSNVYSRVVGAGELRAGYYVAAPYLTKDPNSGVVSGIFAELLEEIGRKLGLGVRWTEEVPYGQMIAALDAGRIDVFGAGAWIDSARGKQAEFSDPVLFDGVCIYARIDDHRFDNKIEALNDPTVRISTIDGEMGQLIADTDFKKTSRESLPQTADFTQMILNVVSGKADIVILAIGPAQKFMAKNPNAIRNLTPDRPLRVFPTAFVYKRGEYELKRMVDFVLMEMNNNGEIERIIKKYEETPGAHYRTARPYAVQSR